MTGRALVSIHDVTPAHWDAVRSLWDRCVTLGTVPALLVVPDWHGRWALEDHPAFMRWLHDRVADGADVMLHGLRHDEHGTPRSWHDHWRALGRTDREGEFLALTECDARARVRRGLDRLRALGLDPIGFVPPAWLMRRTTLDAVAREGLLVTEDERRLYLLRASRPMLGPRVRPITAPAWRWSGRSAMRAHASSAVAAWRARMSRRNAFIRVALHPADLAHPASRGSMSDTLDRIATHAQWLRYRDLVGKSQSADVIPAKAGIQCHDAPGPRLSPGRQPT